ncbi:MAG: CHAD domain-containing protein [Actinobacteria bacterium]|nr:CHAD domain-containing protein [Actinomycetota bacterium]
MTGSDTVLTGREVVGPYVAQCAATIRTSLPLVLADSPDAIHAARVATRRLRTALRTFRPLWVHGHRSLRDELRWYAGLLSRPRDLEVVGDWLESLLRGPEAAALYGDAVADEIAEEVRRDRDEALTTMRKELKGDRFSRLVGELPPADWSPAADLPAELLVVGLAAVPGRTAAEEAAALPEGEERAAAIHELRKTTKEARYAVDALGAAAEEQSELWKKVTSTLGVAQDGQVAQEVLKELAKDAPAHKAVWDALSTMVSQQAAVAEVDGLALVTEAAALPAVRLSAH